MKKRLTYIALAFSIVSIILSGYLFFNSFTTSVKNTCDKTDLTHFKLQLSNYSLDEIPDNVLSNPCWPPELKELYFQAVKDKQDFRKFYDEFQEKRPANADDFWATGVWKVAKEQFPEGFFDEEKAATVLYIKSTENFEKRKKEFLRSDL